MKKLFVFDLDNTLAKSRSPIDSEMSLLLTELLLSAQVGILTSADFNQINECVISKLHSETDFSKLYLMPTSGSKSYTFLNEKFELTYKVQIDDNEREKIKSELLAIIKNLELDKIEKFGDQIQDRKTQITFSALGENAPEEMKRDWDIDKKKRNKIIDLLKEDFPEYKIIASGYSSIDITMSNIDKEFGMNKLLEITNTSIHDAIFFGDSLWIDGNDYPVTKTGVECVAVENPEDTKRYLNLIL